MKKRVALLCFALMAAVLAAKFLLLNSEFALDAGSWKGSQFAGERIPMLAEALRAARGNGALLLDVPVPGMGPVIAETFRAAGLPLSAARLATWDDQQRLEMAKHLPGATIIQADGPPDAWDAEYFAARRAAGVRVFDIGKWPPGFVEQARSAGMPVWVYTINDPQSMRESFAGASMASKPTCREPRSPWPASLA